MCINNYRWPFEKYRLQKIYFGVYTTAQKNVTCLNVREIQRFFFFFLRWGRGCLSWWCVGIHNSRVIWQHNSVKQCATTPAKLHAQFHFGSFFFFFFLTQPSGSRAASLGNHVGSHGVRSGREGRGGRQGGCEFGVLPSWGTVGLASYRLVSLPSLEMAC